MKIPFLKQLQRLTGPATHQINLEIDGPASVVVEQAMQHLLAELPDLLMAAVVDITTGKPLATYTSDRELRISAVTGFNAEVVRQVRASLVAQNQVQESIEEMLFTLPSQLHLLHLVPTGQRFIYLAVDCRDTNLAIARDVMRNSIELLEPPVAVI